MPYMVLHSQIGCKMWRNSLQRTTHMEIHCRSLSSERPTNASCPLAIQSSPHLASTHLAGSSIWVSTVGDSLMQYQGRAVVPYMWTSIVFRTLACFFVYIQPFLQLLFVMPLLQFTLHHSYFCQHYLEWAKSHSLSK